MGCSPKSLARSRFVCQSGLRRGLTLPKEGGRLSSQRGLVDHKLERRARWRAKEDLYGRAALLLEMGASFRIQILLIGREIA